MSIDADSAGPSEETTIDVMSRTPQDHCAAGSVSLVIPAYNEGFRIGQTLAAASRAIGHLPCGGEVILVDDGSDDDTRAASELFAEQHDHVRVISIPHGGKAAALRAGMLAADRDLIVFSDADLATSLDYLPRFLASVEDGFDLVIGSREGAGARRIGEPFYRHLMGRVFNLFVRLLLVPGIQDTQCGFKLFRREAALAILARARLYREPNATVVGARVTAFDVELLVVARRLGYRIETIPVVWTYGSQSKVNPVTDTLNNLRDVLRVKWNDARGHYR